MLLATTTIKKAKELRSPAIPHISRQLLISTANTGCGILTSAMEAAGLRVRSYDEPRAEIYACAIVIGR